MAQLGFIGIGIMGRPMAGHLIKAGHTLFVQGGKAAELAAENPGVTHCQNATEVGSQADVVFLMVPDTPEVEAVLFGQGGLSEGLSPGKTVVDMSSISPVATKEFAARLQENGVEMLDAPVSGGQVGAENAALTIMVGGKPAVFEQIKPYFDLMGKSVTLIGENSHGQAAKIANQIIVAGTLEAVSEALLFASKAGADPAKVREALLGGFAGSKILEVHGERMIKRTFEPGFRIRHQQKDLNNALSAGRALGLSLPGAALAQELYNAVQAELGGDKDHSALITALERLGNHKIG